MTRTESKQTRRDGVFVWGDGTHLSALAPLIEASDLRVVGVGIPPRSGTSGLPEQWTEAERCDDPRIGLQNDDVAIGLFVDAEPLDDPGVLKLCAQGQITPLALGPTPSGIASWAPFRAKGMTQQHARVVPLIADSALFRDALDAIEPAGAVVSADIRMSAPRAFGGVASRLHDAMHLIHRQIGVPERIDASGGFERSGEHATLRSLTGELRAHLRYANCGATLSISDRIDVFARDIVLVCESGVMRITDDGFTLVSLLGEMSDQGAGSNQHPLVEQLLRVTAPHLPAPAPYPHDEVLAMCEAAVLSVRTGQPERPDELLSMMRG